MIKIFSCTVIGVEGKLIEVEVDVTNRGFPSFSIVGLPHKSIEEAKERVRSAIVNSLFSMPDCRITVNLAPADVPKSGSAFDLPIAIGLLIGNKAVVPNNSKPLMILGELSLDGSVKPVKGIIAAVKAAKEYGLDEIVIPYENAEEALLIKGTKVIPIKTLLELIKYIRGEITPSYTSPSVSKKIEETADFATIYGQKHAKRALEIAAAGFHNLHMKGPPGSGKTALSQAFTTILPPMTNDERIDTCSIYSSSGLQIENLLQYNRPFRSPHHTISRNGLIGGGNPPRAGELTLAHRGVLFLDEVPEFPRSVLESLRQPLEDGKVTISRAGSSCVFPSRVQLITASNPCPCGYLGHPDKQCECTVEMIKKYQSRMSGPFLDRIDMLIDLPPVSTQSLLKRADEEKSIYIKQRVTLARKMQAKRFQTVNYKTNTEIPVKDLKKYISLSSEDELLLDTISAKLQLSARTYFKLLRVARTIADISSSTTITREHLIESALYSKRALDK